MSLIYGKDGYKKLQVGYETQVNDTLRRNYAVAKAETDGILAGDLLITTSATQVYARAKAALAGTQKIAGVALATNVKLDPLFPESKDGVKFLPGERGVAVIRGSIAVPFTGTAPTEGAAVYYDYTARAFTTATNGTGTGTPANIPFPGARFTGRTEGNVSEVYIQYI